MAPDDCAFHKELYHFFWKMVYNMFCQNNYVKMTLELFQAIETLNYLFCFRVEPPANASTDLVREPGRWEGQKYD